MTESTIYQDIAKRTGGDIYIGVVGPVRTGKSTFIQKLLDNLVIPNIENEYDRMRAQDTTPQSASGRTVMTTEPKFIPDESVKLRMEDGTELNIKMIDCVGYLVNGALGTSEGDEARMVMTPWSEFAMPFTEAAELGTDKVIGEHSTIAILVTTDGSFGEIPREDYIEAEERVVRELTEKGKPFAIVLNSARPDSTEARLLAISLEEKYSAPVALVSCTELSGDDVKEILKLVLSEFPVTSLNFTLPSWCEMLPKTHPIYTEALAVIDEFTDGVKTLGDVERGVGKFSGIETVSLNAKDGTGYFKLPIPDEKYYSALSEVAGMEITDEKELMALLIDLAKTKKEYSRVEAALKEVNEKGYGIVMPSPEELVLDEPKLTKQSGGWGVKVSAHAESIHMIKTGIKTELCPVVGTEEQSEEVVKYLLGEIEEAPERVWESNMFGKSLYDLVKDGLNAKLLNIPDDSREKLAGTLERIVNEGANGLVCILL